MDFSLNGFQRSVYNLKLNVHPQNCEISRFFLFIIMHRKSRSIGSHQVGGVGEDLRAREAVLLHLPHGCSEDL